MGLDYTTHIIRVDDGSSVGFTAHNIRLDDGSCTKPDVPITMGRNMLGSLRRKIF